MKRLIFRKGAPGFYDWVNEMPRIKLDVFCFNHLTKEDQKKFKSEYKESLDNYRKYERFMKKLNPLEKELFYTTYHHHYPSRELANATRDSKIIQIWESIYYPKGYAPIKTFTKEEIGRKILEARKLDGRSRNEVAAIIGISSNTLKMYETGKRMLKVDVLLSLIQLYDIEFKM